MKTNTTVKREPANRHDYLLKRGWRQIGQGHSGYAVIKYWDHPNHQPDRHGAFTTASALEHQLKADRHGCDCITTT